MQKMKDIKFDNKAYNIKITSNNETKTVTLAPAA